MLLQRLREYADVRLQLPPLLYADAPVRYIIELAQDGRLLSKEPIDTSDPANPASRRGKRFLVPQVQRTVAVKPLLLADNSEYTFGLPRKDPDRKVNSERVAACHQAYLRLLEQCYHETAETSVSAVLTFLKSEPLRQLQLPADFDAGAIVTFRVGGNLVIDLPSVQAFWARYNDPSQGSARHLQCLVCGRERPVLERLQGKIKGIPGGQTSGTALISANADAFESYGLQASHTSPTCSECGERFTKAINYLLAEQESHYVLGGVVFIFWTRDPVQFSLRQYLDTPRPEDVRHLLSSVYSGRHHTGPDSTRFFAVSLSASGGRAVVRDWIDTTVDQVREHLASWFTRQKIVGSYGQLDGFLGMRSLADSTVRDPADLPPTTPRALLRSALTGSPLPKDLLYEAVRRNRAEQTVTRPRAALIKLVLLSQHPQSKEDYMVQLDPNNMSPAYRCGRLLAVLEEVQRLAVPGVKATIVDRFFGTASSAPASVFGRLLRGAQPHLAKLEPDRPGAYAALQQRLEEIQAGLRTFPRTLSLEEQGLFALGYYHQRAYDRAKAREASERRKAGQSSPPDADLSPALESEYRNHEEE